MTQPASDNSGGSAPATTTTPNAGASQPSGQESYDANGRVTGKEDAFLTGDETDNGGEGGENDSGENKDGGENKGGDKSSNNNNAENDNGDEAETTDSGKSKVEDDKLLADKYHTEEELDSGLQGVGLNPGDYKTVEAKEAAYKAANAAMTRWQQQRAEQDKVERERAEEAARSNDTPKTPEELAQKIIGALDMNKITNVGELIQQLVPALVANMPQGGNQPTTEELAARLQPAIQQREERAKALATIEGEVPRLAMKVDPASGKQVPVDPAFRKAFATHLMTGNYPRTAEGLRSAMKEFLSLAESIASGKVAAAAESKENKDGAAQPDESGKGGSNGGGNKSPDDDILGGIIDAFETHDHKVNPI